MYFGKWDGFTLNAVVITAQNHSVSKLAKWVKTAGMHRVFLKTRALLFSGLRVEDGQKHLDFASVPH